MDLSKAFDCISHKLLIAKFRSYGLSISMCHLLTSYLRDRTQRVKLGNKKSKWLHIGKGSAQGSILGPFCHHFSHICQKAGKQVKVLGRLSRVLNESNKLLFYSSFIACYFNYCCALWHFCNNSDTLKIEKLQEKALRYSMLDSKDNIL